MAALVGREDAQGAGQRRQDRPVGPGVEAVGMQQDHVRRPVRRPEVQERHLAGAGRRRQAGKAQTRLGVGGDVIRNVVQMRGSWRCLAPDC